MRRYPALLLLGFAVGLATPAGAQTRDGNAVTDAGAAKAAAAPAATAVTRDELEAIAAELTRLRAEVAELRGQITAARGTEARYTGAPGTEVQGTEARAADGQAVPSIEMLRSQVEEFSQTKVESGSRMPVRLFGAIVSNTVGNSGTANWLENPNIVDSEIAGTEPGSFTSTLKQSHVGVNVGPIPMGSWTASGAMVADFFGGTPGFATGTVFGLPRLVYAFARLENGGTTFEIGQDHNLLAPRDPTSLAAQSFPLLFRSGNLYLRSPQVRVEQRLGGITLKGGIAAPLAADAANFYTFAPVAGAGERSGRPAIEGRADYTAGTPEGASEFTIGVSARYGWRKPALETTSASSYAADFNARVGRIGFAGEYFTTDNAAEFGSAVAQARPAQGGWLEGRVRITPKLSANAGVGLDEVDEPVPVAARAENRSVFGNFIVDLTPEVAVSMEYRWLETSLGQAVKRTNSHVNAVFVLRF